MNRKKHNSKPPKQNSEQYHKGKETMEIQSNQKMRDKMVVVSPHISVITLNVNRLNSPIKSTE